MKFKISATNSRHEIDDYELDSFYDENLLGVDRYSFIGGLYLHITDDYGENIKKIGSLQTTFLDEELISNETTGSLARIADSIDEETSRAFGHLEKSNIFHRPCQGGIQLLPFHSCYIATFYIDSEYRSKGLGSHLLNNLSRIYLHMFNIYVNCVIVYPKPSRPKTGWGHKDEELERRKQMCEFFEKNGFEEIGGSGFYVRNYKIEL